MLSKSTYGYRDCSVCLGVNEKKERLHLVNDSSEIKQVWRDAHAHKPTEDDVCTSSVFFSNSKSKPQEHYNKIEMINRLTDRCFTQKYFMGR